MSVVVSMGLLAGGFGHREDSYPSDAQVIGYLEGKQLTVADSDGQKKGQKQLQIPKGGIVAIEINTGGSRTNTNGLSNSGWVASNNPYVTGVIFIAKVDGKRYAVEGDIKHIRVGTDRAFYGFTTSSIVEQ